MVRFFRTRRGKLALGVAIVSIGVSGALAGTALTAGGATSPPVDHFLCYTASSSPNAAGVGFKVPPNVRLINQFAPNGVVPKIGAVDLHCNPAQKTVPTHVTPISNPSAHLLCWRINAAAPSKTVLVTNQFGRATLKTGLLSQVCLPSWKSLTGPPKNRSVAPPKLSHFTCYLVAYAPGTTTRFKPPSSVLLKDQFSPRPVSVKVGAPVLLCLPTTKIVHGASFPAVNTKTHLLCYSVSPTPTKTPVYDQDQFGTGKVNIARTALLCLPSTKIVLPPATTTTSCPPTIACNTTTTICPVGSPNCPPPTTTTMCPNPAGNCQLQPPVISKSFGATQMPIGGQTTLTFTITNPNATNLTGVGFNDNLPAGLQVATPNGESHDCGPATATVNAPPGGPTVSLTGATLAGGMSCHVVVMVKGVGQGTQNNTTDPVTSTETGPGGTASASILVG